MLCTGMRGQEMLGLEPRHIAKDGSSINMEQAVVRIKGSVAIGELKSQDSYRTIPVPDNVQYCARLLRENADKFFGSPQKIPAHPVIRPTLRNYLRKRLGQ